MIDPDPEEMVPVTEIWTKSLPFVCTLCAADLFRGEDGSLACDGRSVKGIPHEVTIWWPIP